jgi:hypothetical protein
VFKPGEKVSIDVDFAIASVSKMEPREEWRCRDREVSPGGLPMRRHRIHDYSDSNLMANTALQSAWRRGKMEFDKEKAPVTIPHQFCITITTVIVLRVIGPKPLPTGFLAGNHIFKTGCDLGHFRA